MLLVIHSVLQVYCFSSAVYYSVVIIQPQELFIAQADIQKQESYQQVIP